MKYTVCVKPNAGADRVEREQDGSLVVHVRALPKGGEANEALRYALAEYFDIAPSRITIVSGFRSRKKIIEIR